MKKHPLLDFEDKKLLRRALTHRSYVNENPGSDRDNERLEFLGDAILNFLSGEYLYNLSPEMGEDEMTRRRSALVDEKQLTKFAIEMGLDFEMRLGQGTRRDGGSQNPNLLSSTFEAVVGAYYLDHQQNIETLRPLIEELFKSVSATEMIERSSVDSKNRFQEFVQKQGITQPPRYVTEKVGGSDHNPEFISRVYVGDKCCGEGKGRSKKNAEKSAAEEALSHLKKRGLLD